MSDVADARAPDARRHLQAFAALAARPLRLAGVCTVLAGALLVPQALLIARAMQQIFVDHAPVRAVAALLAGLAAVGVLRALLGWASRRLADEAVETVRVQVRARLARRLVARGPRWLRHRRSGELAEMLGGHVDALEGYLGGFLPVRLEVVAVPLLILIGAFWADRVVGLILLFTLPLAPIFMMLVGWGAEAASRRQLQALARMGGHFADRLRGLGLIRLYGRGDSELAGIEQAAEGLRHSSLKVLRIAFLSSAVLEFFASLSVAMIALYLGLSYLGMLDLRGPPLDLATGVFCLLLAPEFYAPLRRLATHYHDRAAALAAAGEMAHLLEDIEPEIAPASPATADVASDPRAPAVRVDGLALRPADRVPLALRDLSFELQAGGHLAIAGASGGGKSTLLEALAGWLPPVEGSIQYDTSPRIGYAPQRPFLFQGTLADNLRIAAPGASDAELEHAAEAAQVMRFARRLPRGLHTVIGERGFGLSGGEARRVALARLFLRKPDLLLLDEPTAFLDPETERAVLQALAEFACGRTLIMATHSPAAMRMAGRVLDLRDAHAHAAEAPA
ncbi:thiol reductant ABC exporter subunit CydD [Pseudomonas sp. R2.Fl]|nr:thiol reductant ABC exporter subunit CydD [Pseudomonas sp. R2.Fl]